MDLEQAPIQQEQREQREERRRVNQEQQTNKQIADGIDRDTIAVVTDRTARVFIRNVPNSLIERFDNNAMLVELNAVSNGGVVRYNLFTGRDGRFTGQAMCTFNSPAAADAAIKALNGRQFAENEAPVDMELAKEHSVLLGSQLRQFEHEQRLVSQPWRHDRFEAMNRPRGGRGGGRGGGGGPRGAGRGGRGGAVTQLDLDSQLDSYLA